VVLSTPPHSDLRQLKKRSSRITINVRELIKKFEVRHAICGNNADATVGGQVTISRETPSAAATAAIVDGSDPGMDHLSGRRYIYKRISAELAIAATVSVIIPARNEAPNLPHVFASIPEWVDEVILVDGHSTDETVAVARRLWPQLRILPQVGYGKGDALVAGFAASTGDIIVTMDADGSTDGAEILRFVAALAAGADFAKGSRFASAGGTGDITAVRRYGNRILSMLVNRLFGTQYTDLCYGFNAFWAEHIHTLGLDCDGFEVETLMNIRAAQAGLRVQEIPSFEHPRVYGSSNLRIALDGWRIGKVIVREWASQRQARRSSSEGRSSRVRKFRNVDAREIAALSEASENVY
jgi:Glycosyl transferase family 2